MDLSGSVWKSVSWRGGLMSQALVMWAEESVLVEGDQGFWISFIDSMFLLVLLHWSCGFRLAEPSKGLASFQQRCRRGLEPGSSLIYSWEQE